ncbi:MAG: hypothetical protein WEB64_10695 [Marinobacter sp.]|uniref:hypothetical protein n=1 Tax=Marinobacter sp. TaxID=50741 RepID=UPI0034A088CF
MTFRFPAFFVFFFMGACPSHLPELVDYTGRVIHPSKRGYIPDDTPPILQRLGLSQDEWLQEACEFEARYTQNQRAEQGRRRRAA